MQGLGWIAAIIVGGLSGWIASRLMKARTGLILNIFLGIVGAVFANWLLGLLGIFAAPTWIAQGAVAIAGACALIFLMRVIRG